MHNLLPFYIPIYFWAIGLYTNYIFELQTGFAEQIAVAVSQQCLVWCATLQKFELHDEIICLEKCFKS